MKNSAKIFLLSLLALPAFVLGQTIPTLDQWTSTTSPSSAITQRTPNKSVKITGLTTGLCLTLDTNNLLTTTACGTSALFPFTRTTYGVSTSTTLGLLNGFFSTASSTISNLLFGTATGTSATTTNFFATTASSTSLYSSFFQGGGLVTCNGASSALTWSGGYFGCNTIAAGTAANSKFATSTNGFALSPNGGSSIALVLGGSATTTTGALLEVLGNAYVSGSTTLQKLTFTNATGTNATTTNFFSTLASSTDTYFTTGHGSVIDSLLSLTSGSSVNGITIDAVTQITGNSGGSVTLNTRNLTLGGSAWQWTTRDSGGSTYNLMAINNALTNGNGETSHIGIGTTTPRWRLQVEAKAAPQLALTDATSLSTNHWTFANIAGLLYISTSSPSTFATSTVPALKIDANGLLTFSALNSTTTNATSTNAYATTFNAVTASTTNATTTNLTVTAKHLIVNSGLDTAYITGTSSPAFNLASTTLDALGKSFSVGTSTFLLKNNPEAITLNGFYCMASTTGTAIVNFSHDNGNKTEYGICTTGTNVAVYNRVSTNNTFTAGESFNVQASSTSGSVNRITVTAVIKKTSD